MNPLSPFAYHRRHKGRALLLVSLIALATLGVCVMVRVPDAFAEQYRATIRYLTRFSVVSALGPALEPGVVARVRTHPGVAQAIFDKGLYISVPMDTSGGFRLFGVPEADLPVVMKACDLRLKEGRLLRARTNEVMLSETLADALALHVGDPIGRSIDERYYGSMPTTMVLVGILEDEPLAQSNRDSARARRSAPGVLTGFVSYEYLDSHELYASQPSLIVIPREGRKAEVDRFLQTTTASPLTRVTTYQRTLADLAQGMRMLHLIFGVVDGLAAVVIALVVGGIHQIGMAERLPEFGLLRAIGYGRRRLIGRLVAEMVSLAGAGWIAGLALSWLLFAWLKVSVLPSTMGLDLWNVTAVWFALPIPLVTIALVALSVRHTFARLDAVAIIERGKLAVDAGDRQRPRHPRASHSSPRAWSAWTFYLRHKRRGLMLTVTIGLMILGVAFPAILFVPMVDAIWLFTEYLRQVSVLSPRAGASIDPGVVAQVRSHPAVARVVPAMRLGLMIDMPPMNHNPARIYGVSEDDMQFIIDLYGVRLLEGHLPRPRSNEVVLSQAMAMNRSLRLGDRVGWPVHELDSSLPTEMVVVGILSGWERDARKRDLWLGFASLEYLSNHELYALRPLQLLLIPVEGRKAELDAWLEEQVASEQTSVQTHKVMVRKRWEDMLAILLICAVPESVISVVAAAALSVLSYTFFSQRREEFGTLHALGHSRRRLVWRTAGETACVVAAAWLLGAAMCGIGLAGIQFGLYAPKGLSVRFANPVPWLLTLPMPLSVVAVSTGLVARVLSRLDPVSVIEQR
jgi:ABC-type antimicrobial peptide transport system permease subunit